jgi:hypothetical protein
MDNLILGERKRQTPPNYLQDPLHVAVSRDAGSLEPKYGSLHNLKLLRSRDDRGKDVRAWVNLQKSAGAKVSEKHGKTIKPPCDSAINAKFDVSKVFGN